jgi:lipoprotein signal peptidase
MPLGGLTLSVVRNEGFAFSVGAERIAFGLVLMARVAALGAIVLLCRHIVYLLDYRNACGFALLFAGGLGNAADLLFRGGAVVDFIGAGPFPLGWSEEPAYLQLFFNTADLFILVGIGLLGPLISETGKSVERRCAGWLQGRVWGRGTG